jgi:hypothetical protein
MVSAGPDLSGKASILAVLTFYREGGLWFRETVAQGFDRCLTDFAPAERQGRGGAKRARTDVAGGPEKA